MLAALATAELVQPDFQVSKGLNFGYGHCSSVSVRVQILRGEVVS